MVNGKDQRSVAAPRATERRRIGKYYHSLRKEQEMNQNKPRPHMKFAIALFAAAPLMPSAALAVHTAVADVVDCDQQTVGMGPNVQIRWTSDFKKTEYVFTAPITDGDTVSGTGEVVEVTTQWVIYDKKKGAATNVPTKLVGVGLPTFEVEGMFVPVPPDHVPSPGDASECGIDPNARSYRTHTAFVSFTKLKQPGSRPFASGKAQWDLFVKRGGFDLVLDITLDVETPGRDDGPDDEEEE
ncbi:MAG: hypothetical protein ACT4P5_19585 [Armatimonadota bacterium]